MAEVGNRWATPTCSIADNAAQQCTADAATAQVTFNTSKSTSFTYHADTGKYTAVQYKGDYKDGATGEPVPFSNLLILSADMKTVDSYGRLAVDLIGSGNTGSRVAKHCLTLKINVLAYASYKPTSFLI